jgi:L-Ala-D/L-Glu epimerase
MQINTLKIQSLHIPFTVSFNHSSAKRSQTETILVTCTTSNNNQGIGEGCPRSYVTGESLESCHRFFEKNQQILIETIHDITSLRLWVDNNEQEINSNPAAWCAIELSILEALSIETETTIERLIDLPKLDGDFQYSAIISNTSLRATHSFVAQFAQVGFNDFKLKITGDSEQDNAKLDVIKQYAPNARVRIDANTLFSASSDIKTYLSSLKYTLFAIEEPLKAKEFQALNELTNSIDIPIILDESFTNTEDFNTLDFTHNAFIINLRISKMGGLLRSLDIAKKAQEKNIPIIIGAQVGETSILTRVAITVANMYKENLLAQEGAFGTLLLSEDITNTPIMFGKEGKIKSKNINQNNYGFGIDYQLPLKPK